MNRKVLLGCGCAAVCLATIVIATLIFVVPRAFEKGSKWVRATLREKMAESRRRSALEEAWQPPSPTLDASWFPATIGPWTLESSADTTGVPALEIERAGRQGVYRAGEKTITVDLLPATELEKEALFARAKTALENARTQRFTTDSPINMDVRIKRDGHLTIATSNRLYVRTGPLQTRLWWLKEWLFIFRTADGHDPDPFAAQYLDAARELELELR